MNDPLPVRVVGPLSLDRYLDEDLQLPGGGALNMAYHWRRRRHPTEVVSRIATAAWPHFEPFLDLHGIEVTDRIVVAGVPCSIDIRFADDRQPVMDGFIEGVLADFELTKPEEERVLDGVPTHFVVVDAIDRAIHRIVERRPDAVASARWTGDFLSFRHMTPERFSATMQHLELGVVGWPGDPGDALVDELADRACDARSILVVTFGSHGVVVVDGRDGVRSDRWFDVDARPVVGTTVGCGDAFGAALLSTWFTTGDLAAAVDTGRVLGAAATEWKRPLPDDAYGAAVS